jgi:hypothetical protein
MSRFMPCSECGASVDRTAADAHSCDPEQKATYAMFAMRHEIDAFESRLWDFLGSSDGRFEVWMAARHVRRSR